MADVLRTLRQRCEGVGTTRSAAGSYVIVYLDPRH
jgi:hypothetical protein